MLFPHESHDAQLPMAKIKFDVYEGTGSGVRIMPQTECDLNVYLGTDPSRWQ